MGEETTTETAETTTETTEATTETQTQEFVEIKDPLNGKAIQVPKEQAALMQTLIGHAISTTRNKTKEENVKELKDLNDKLGKSKAVEERLAQLEQDIELGKLSPAEKVAAEIRIAEEKGKKESEQIQIDRDMYKGLFEERSIVNDIYGGISGIDLNNQQQSMELLRMQGKAKLVQEEDGSYRTVLMLKNESGDFDALDPKAAAEKFFSLPENLHHLKKNTIPGSGSSQGNMTTASGELIFSKEEFAKSAEVRKQYKEAQDSGKQVTLK